MAITSPPAENHVPASPPKLQSLRGRALRASAWTVGGLVTSRALRFGSSLVMTRLLFPEAFGLMAAVNAYLTGARMLSDVGLGPSVIHNTRGDEPYFLNTAWTIQIIRGICIWLGLAALAWPLTIVYGEPQLLWLIVASGLAAIIAGFESTATFTLRRRLELRRLTYMEIGTQAVTIVSMIAWALIWPSVWALVVGAVLGASVRTVWSHFLIAGYSNRLAWDSSAASAVLDFGKWIFLSSGIGFLATQLDRMILPTMIPFQLMGVYSIAMLLATMPEYVLSKLGYKVMFPALSKLTHLPRIALRRKIIPMRGKLLAAIALASALLATLGDWLVQWLYDPRYHQAGWILTVLALGLWPRLVTNTVTPVLLAIGQPRYLAYAAAVRTLWILIGVPVGHLMYGLPGVVWVVSASSLSDYVIESYGLHRHGLWIPRQDAKATLWWLAMLLLLVVARGSVPWVYGGTG